MDFRSDDIAIPLSLKLPLRDTRWERGEALVRLQSGFADEYMSYIEQDVKEATEEGTKSMSVYRHIHEAVAS
jgi:hypothetical protein